MNAATARDAKRAGLEAMARAKTASASTAELLDGIAALRVIINLRIATKTNASEIVQAHVWVCDELERRYPEQTLAWLDTDDDDPRPYFVGVA